MRKILIIGSGKSTSYLLKYLLEKSVSENLLFTVGDINTNNAEILINNHQNAKAIKLDVFDKDSRTRVPLKMPTLWYLCFLLVFIWKLQMIAYFIKNIWLRYHM